MYDVIVVGAGPAGSVTAAVLAQQGRQVLLLDKAGFPRDKVCGDCISWKSIRLLSDLGLSLKSETPHIHSCERVRAISPNGHIFEGSLHSGDGYHRLRYVIPRKSFDHALWKFALQQGAEFERLRVSEPILEKDVVCGVRGSIDGRVMERRARITIAADGAHSVIARFLCPGGIAAKHRGVATRAYFRGVQGLDHCLEFHFDQTACPGYGWLFPLGEGVANVGVGQRLDVLKKNGGSLRRAFERFVCHPRVAARLSNASLIGEPKGWPLPFAPQRFQRAHHGALLVGDAGASVSPLMGAGIHNALETGRTAAQVSVRALQRSSNLLEELREFEVWWQSVLGRRLMVEVMLQRLLSWPGVLDLLIRQMSRSERLARSVLNRI